jgi:hypothetical protein
VSFSFAVFYEQIYQFVPLGLEVLMIDPDEIISVYDKGRNTFLPLREVFDGEDGMHGIAEVLDILPSVEFTPVQKDDDPDDIHLRLFCRF